MVLKNNPLCLVYDFTHKNDGEIDPKNGYCQFVSVTHCFISGIVKLKKQFDAGQDSVARIIPSWCSVPEDSDRFVESVSKRMGLSADFPLTFCEFVVIHLLSAISFYQSNYSDDSRIRWSWDEFKRLYVY